MIVAARRAATPATARGHDFSADAANQVFQHAELFCEEQGQIDTKGVLILCRLDDAFDRVRAHLLALAGGGNES